MNPGATQAIPGVAGRQSEVELPKLFCCPLDRMEERKPQDRSSGIGVLPALSRARQMLLLRRKGKGDLHCRQTSSTDEEN